MPSTVIVYGTSATQAATADRDWTNLANLTLAPDDVQATVSLFLFNETTEVALIGPDGLGIIQPPGFVPQTVTLYPRVADSGFLEAGTNIRAQLYDSTTAIGNALTLLSTTGSALATYTITKTAAQYGVTLTRGLVQRLRVGIWLVGGEVSSNVGIDSVGVVVGGVLADSREERIRFR